MKNQQNQNLEIRQNQFRWLVILIFVCLFIGSFLPSCSNLKEEKPETVSPSMPSSTEITQNMANDMQGVDFGVFKHESPQHDRLPCLLCHVRNDDSPKPRLSGHTPCASCHVQQFADKSNAICTVCHTNKETGEVKAFPALASFNVKFNHAAHFKETNCAACHKNENGGGMSKPSAADAHATCFQCHTADKLIGEKNIGSCSTCHEKGTPNRIVDTAKTIGFNFDHARHSGVNCQSCHNETTGNQMSEISVAMHKDTTNSCATCHNEQKAFGANEFSDCRRCHQEVANVKSFGVKFAHTDHSKANCATCHKPGGNGVTFSIPNGQNAHTTCFQCHQPMKDSGSFTASKCFQCHQPGSSNKLNASTPVIKGNFNHTKHKKLSCNGCHTANSKGVSAPTVAMHKASKGMFSCASCHNNQKAFGGEDFSDCKRCHTSGNFKF